MRLPAVGAPAVSARVARWGERRAIACVRATRPADAPRLGPDDWTGADLLWELYQEQAALGWRAGEAVAPTQHWARALEIADRCFGRGDPRLAASLTNQAFVLRRRAQVHQANRRLDQALEVWADGWRWLELMTPPKPDTAASDRIYGRASRATFMALLAQGRAATLALARYRTLPEDRINLWFELRPHRLSDVRKLLAAVLLIVPIPE